MQRQNSMQQSPNIALREPIDCWDCDKKHTAHGRKCGAPGRRRRRAQERAETRQLLEAELTLLRTHEDGF